MLRNPRFWFALVSIWFVVLFFLSNASHLTPPGPEFDHRDKIYHAIYYSLGGAWFFAGLRLFKLSRNVWKTTLLTVLFCSAVGVFDEWHQSFIPNRSGNDLGDWCADTFGGVLGAALGTLTLVVLKLRPSEAKVS
jgi:VanZ family protein